VRKETEEMRSQPAHVSIHLMSDPCLWCWSFVDPGSGRILESSWSTYWAGFESREDAGEDARRRLAILCAEEAA
jgi:hypothetical protein